MMTVVDDLKKKTVVHRHCDRLNFELCNVRKWLFPGIIPWT